MTDQIHIGVLGADGRMGAAVIKALSGRNNVKLTAALTAPDSPHLGKLVSNSIAYSDDIKAGLESCDVMIDFSAPRATLKAAEWMGDTRCKALVSGTTGLTVAQENRIAKTAASAVILRSGNFSLGVNLLEALVEQAARSLKTGWDIEVLEMHHKRKVDAPSGTALMLGRAAAKGRGVTLPDALKTDRNGAREEGEIGFSVLRGGDVIGMHDVRITSELEMITLAHQAFDRTVFAEGAVDAAIWAAGQKPGLYSMRDMLNLD